MVLRHFVRGYYTLLTVCFIFSIVLLSCAHNNEAKNSGLAWLACMLHQ